VQLRKAEAQDRLQAARRCPVSAPKVAAHIPPEFYKGYCDRCSEIDDDSAVPVVRLCPFHAAATELLEACKVLADQVHDDVPHAYERVHAALGAVQDAIAKAGAK
jgi:hypothetical protein